MKRLTRQIAVLGIGFIASSCVSLVPGADEIKISSSAADVQSCRSMGNIDARGFNNPVDIEHTMRDQAVGLRANVVLTTSLTTGVAYSCTDATTSR
jgi:hypothetical protein